MYELTQVIRRSRCSPRSRTRRVGGEATVFAAQEILSKDMFHPGNLINELWSTVSLPGQEHAYPSHRRGAIDAALAEAWAWLEAQGLVVPAADTNGRNGWRILSRRARRFTSEAEFTSYTVARMLPRDTLHPRIADKVWWPSCAENLMLLHSKR